MGLGTPTELILPAFVLVFIGVVLFVYFRQNSLDVERARAIQAVADAKGWSYRDKDPGARKELGIPFGLGSQWQSNFVRGTAEGTAFLLFDYIIATKNNRIERTWAAFKLPEQSPRFRVIPNTWLNLLDRSLTWSRLSFPQDPAFSEAFRVESPDGQRAEAMFNDAVRSRLSHAAGWSVESRNGWLQLTGPGFPAPEELESFLNQGINLARPFLG